MHYKTCPHESFQFSTFLEFSVDTQSTKREKRTIIQLDSTGLQLKPIDSYSQGLPWDSLTYSLFRHVQNLRNAINSIKCQRYLRKQVTIADIHMYINKLISFSVFLLLYLNKNVCLTKKKLLCIHSNFQDQHIIIGMCFYVVCR